jgi:hypothetical protein
MSAFVAYSLGMEVRPLVRGEPQYGKDGRGDDQRRTSAVTVGRAAWHISSPNRG